MQILNSNGHKNSVPLTILEEDGLWHGRLLKFETLSSTNNWAIENHQQCRHGDVVWAVRQTAGRGRMSRTWVSPEERGLTFSVILRNIQNPECIQLLGQAAALAVREALEKYEIQGLLKWPNDIIVHDKKIAGILSETAMNNRVIIVGVGLNVNMDQEDLRSATVHYSATSMHMETGKLFDPDSVRKCLFSNMESIFDTFIQGRISSLPAVWDQFDWLAGSYVEIRSANKKTMGMYAGIDGRGRIRIINQTGDEKVFWAGDVIKIRPISPDLR